MWTSRFCFVLKFKTLRVFSTKLLHFYQNLHYIYKLLFEALSRKIQLREHQERWNGILQSAVSDQCPTVPPPRHCSEGLDVFL